MQEFICPDRGVTVAGTVVNAFLDAFGPYRSRGEKVVARHCGVDGVPTSLDAQYPLAEFLAAMRELQEQFGVSFMQKMGEAIYERAAFPPGIETITAVLASIDQAYHMNHANAEGRIGSYEWAPRDDHGGVMVCDNPYPCSFDLGLLKSVSARFDASSRVTHDDAKPCRHRGGESCTYVVEW